jgi:hypothetical protein
LSLDPIRQHAGAGRGCRMTKTQPSHAAAWLEGATGLGPPGIMQKA